MPLLKHNISANEQLFKSARPQATVLDWDDDVLPEEIQSLDTGIDAIVCVHCSHTLIPISLLTSKQNLRMTDVTYNTASFPSLIRTLSNLVQLNAKKNVEIGRAHV